MIRRLIILLLIVGCVFGEKRVCDDRDWRFIMPEFEKELQILLESDVNLNDSSRFINYFGEVQSSWKIPHDVYFKNIKNNITAELSQFLNPDYINIFYKTYLLKS